LWRRPRPKLGCGAKERRRRRRRRRRSYKLRPINVSTSFVEHTDVLFTLCA
jgi:hypothetical protein